MAQGSTASIALVTAMLYDANGNVLSQTEASGTAQARTTSYSYDALGRQIKTTYPPMSVYNSAMYNVANSGTQVVRTEMQLSVPYSQVTYNTLGDAVVNLDTSGNYSHKVYDQLGGFHL